MKNIKLICLAFFSLLEGLSAQVPKKIVVEHFTNSRCSICASSNPGFYFNLSNQPGVIHLAVHPSSPYPACLLSQHNVPENDGRTNYYGIYGSTPKFVIQGVLVSTAADYSSDAIFVPYKGQTSPASIRIVQTKFGTDSIRARVVIKTEAQHSLDSLKLFVALSEDTLFYASPNGEKMHFDVFRKALTPSPGISIKLPATPGDSVVYTRTAPSDPAWNLSRINTTAILREKANKQVIQSETTIKKAIVTGISEITKTELVAEVFSNPVTGQISLSHTSGKNELFFSLYDLAGRVVLKQTVINETEQIDASGLTAGIYLFRLQAATGPVKSGKLILH